MQEKISQHNKIARIILIVFLFLQPLILNPYGFNVYSSLRVLLLYSVVTFLVLLKIYDFFTSGSIKFYNIKPLQWLLFFAGGLIISTVFSIHVPTSIFGKYPRFEGIITWLACILIFILVLDSFRKKEHIAKLVKAISISSIIISIYGIAQFFGYDIIAWGPVVFAVKRAFSSLGNPVSFGAYLALIAPINIYFAVRNKSLVFIVAGLLNILALVLTFSITSWIAFILAVITLVIINGKKIVITRKVSLGVGISLLFVALLVSFLMTPRFKSRIEQISQGLGSYEARLLIYNDALPMFTKRPFIGSGPDTFQLAFSQNLSPQYERKVTRNSPADRAHNEILQVGLTMGLISLIPYLVFFYYLFMGSIKALAKKEESYYADLLKATLAGIIGYLVVMQTFFGTIGDKPLFWGVLGLLTISFIKINKVKISTFEIKAFSVKKGFVKPIIVIISIALMSVPLSYGVRLVFADYYYRQAKLAFGAKYYNDSFYFFEKSTTLASGVGYYLDKYGQALTQVGTIQKNSLFLDRAMSTFDKLNRYNPKNSYYYLGSGRSCVASYKQNHKKFLLGKAEQKFRKGLSFDENFSFMRYELASVQYKLGEFREAATNLEKALETKADIEPAYLLLAKTYKKLGNIKAAKHYASLATKRQSSNKEARSFYNLIKHK